MSMLAANSTRRSPFTRKIFSTKALGPGHVIGAGILVVGTIGITRALVARAQARRLPPPTRVVDNARGQYGADRKRTP